MQKVLFYFSRSTGSIKILVSIKNLGHYKKLPSDKFVKKKRTFCKTFHSMWNFFTINCFVDYLLDFLELSMLSILLYIKCYLIKWEKFFY